MLILVILANIFSAAVMVGILTASGTRLRRWLRLPAGPSDRWATDLVIGAGLCSLWILGLGLIGQLGPPIVIVGIAAQAAIGRWRRKRPPVQALLIAAMAGLPNLVIAVGPPHFYDAMVYHLGLPWQALLSGGWTAHPEDLFSAFPPLAQMSAVPALSLELYRVPGILHWWAWVVAAVAAGGLSRRLGAPKMVGNLVIAATMLLSVTPLVPGFPAAEGWFLAALIPAMCAALTQRRRQSSSILMMLLLGLAAATRVQGLVWLVILLGLRMLTNRNRTFLFRGIPLVLVGSSPWWLKNLILLGDPLAPIFWNRNGIETLWRDASALLNLGASPIALISLIPSLLLNLGPTILITTAAAALAAILVKRKRIVFATACLGIAAWAATGALPRFFAPTLLLLIITASNWGRTPMPERSSQWAWKLFRSGAIVVVGANLAVGLILQMQWLDLIKPLDLLAKNFVDAAAMVAPNPPFAAFRALDEILPPEATILLVGEPRIFGVPREVIAPSQHDPSPLQVLCEGADPPSAFAQHLRKQGITHLVINDGELARLGDAYPVAPWKTSRGEGRWWTFLQTLGPPIHQLDGVRTYSIQ